MTMGSIASSNPAPDVAIVGGGIVGLILAAGLHRRAIPVNVYEQSSTFRESGAGIGFNKAAKACMDTIDPAILTALRACGGVPMSAADPNDNHDYLRWSDGYSKGAEALSDSGHAIKELDSGEPWQKLYLKADAGYKGIEGTRRDHFLDELSRVLPSERIHFNKKLQNIQDPKDGGRVTLTFEDGTTATADAVIGCDGIRSKTREFVLTPTSPPSEPTYSHVRSYRALLPMSAAAEALGTATAAIYHNHIGPAANLIHYPVAQNMFVNVALFIHDPDDWPEASWTTRDSSRSEIEAALQDWHPRIRNLVKALPETIPVLGVFDMHDHPLAHYNNGSICVAGDAAHASSPHHGAGAGMGIEDALCLASLLSEVTATMRMGGVSKAAAVTAALAEYDGARRTRSQWLVNSSRRVCDLQHSSSFANPEKRVVTGTYFEEILDRTLKIWNFDHLGMVSQSIEKYAREINNIRLRSKEMSK